MLHNLGSPSKAAIFCVIALGLAKEFIDVPSPETAEYVGGESGVLVIAGLKLAAIVIVPRLRGMNLAPAGRPVAA